MRERAVLAYRCLMAARASVVGLVLGASVIACGGEPARTSVSVSPTTTTTEVREGEAEHPPQEAATHEQPSRTSEPPSTTTSAHITGPSEPPSRSHASCVSREAAREVPLSRPGAIVEVHERTFLYAWHRDGLEDPTAVLLALDARGAVVETRLAAGYPDPIAIAARPGGLLVVWSPPGGTPHVQTLDVAEDGRVIAGPDRAIEGLDRGWPGTLAASESHALLVQRVAGGEGSGDPSGFFVIDLEHAAMPPGTELKTPVGGTSSQRVRGGIEPLVIRIPHAPVQVEDAGIRRVALHVEDHREALATRGSFPFIGAEASSTSTSDTAPSRGFSLRKPTQADRLRAAAQRDVLSAFLRCGQCTRSWTSALPVAVPRTLTIIVNKPSSLR